MEKRGWRPPLAIYTVKGLLKPHGFWWTAWNLLLVRHDGEQFIHPVGYNLWDSGWSEYTFNSQTRRTYGSFAKRFKKEKKMGGVPLDCNKNPVGSMVTGGKLNFPSWSPSSPAQMVEITLQKCVVTNGSWHEGWMNDLQPHAEKCFLAFTFIT